jgi:hypothetical protein
MDSLVDIWVVSTIWLLQITPLEALGSWFLCRRVVLFLSGSYPGVELAHMVMMFSVLRNCQNGFQNGNSEVLKFSSEKQTKQ